MKFYPSYCLVGCAVTEYNAISGENLWHNTIREGIVRLYRIDADGKPQAIITSDGAGVVAMIEQLAHAQGFDIRQKHYLSNHQYYLMIDNNEIYNR